MTQKIESLLTDVKIHTRKYTIEVHIFETEPDNCQTGQVITCELLDMCFSAAYRVKVKNQ